jgi:DNA-binding NtrC family response regulator
MSVRTGLVVDRTGLVSAELDRLRLAGWKFQVATSIEAAHRALTRDAPLIGIVAFDRVRTWELAELEPLFALPGHEWIALVEEGLLCGEKLPSALLRHFTDFHTLPLRAERLLVTLGHAYGKAAFCRSHEDTPGDSGRFGMTGSSRRMLQLYRQLEKVVKVDAPVLIGGESGTGKELVSRAIHQYSARAGGPFIAMNCGAIPPTLIHSELFGYERGAFTGAVQRKVGSIEAANHGVLFLDEIGDLPLDLQASLLRFLQEKMIVRVGSNERLKIDVRVLAATHVDLQRAVAEGKFRQDLYYRLNVLGLQVPALRERKEDIPLLAQTVFANNCGQLASQVRGFSTKALRAMVDYDWPGNVRELVNRVQHAMIMSENRLISVADLGLPAGPGDATPTLGELRTTVEREVVEASLRKYSNNISETARQLGISRVTLYRLIDRLKIVL